jgi:hypothetical protein
MTTHPTWYQWKIKASDDTTLVAYGASYPDAQQKAQTMLEQYEKSIKLVMS